MADLGVQSEIVNTSFFSSTYREARRRFLESARSAGAGIHSYPIDVQSRDELAIDVASVGPVNAPAIAVSSGTHGVEGFFGSAVQLALLKSLGQETSQPDIRYVLIHALNPFGFSHIRRVNEDNIDLNRNFLVDAGGYKGAPSGYARFDSFLNPASAPLRFEPFRLKAAWYIQRYGLQAIKQSVAGGQYQFPRGLFFGGHGPSSSARCVYEHCNAWIGGSERIVHIDLHTGLGRFGIYKLLVTERTDSEQFAWYTDVFGADCVESLNSSEGTAYKVSGSFGEWMQQNFNTRMYRFAAAEFGTYGLVRVLGATRAENRAHYYGSPDSRIYRSIKAEFLECFCPGNTGWRNQVIGSGLQIIDQAARALNNR